ncbi:MAG TPA: SDR family NAD(P)-dependent oxidoreductase, partial [Blastocatellia bacterium]
MINLTGKTAIITGASRGIGAAAAILFAEAGANIVINYHRDSDSAKKVADECEKRSAQTLTIRADVSRKTDAEKMIRRTIDHFGALDILIANAGIWKEAAIEKMTEEEWDETIRIN